MAKAKDKKPTLDEIMAALDKKYGEKAVIKGDEIEAVDEVISTGSLGLDIATGIGGIPVSSPEKGQGKVIEIYGWESSGKSTLVQTIIGNTQKKGGKVLLVDSENSLDEVYSAKLGINLKELYLIQLDSGAGEAAYDKMQMLITSGEFKLVVVDSYNALQPQKIIEDSLENANMGLHARMMSKVLAKANNQASEFGTTFIFVGQLREKIGVMWGSPETTQGGNAMRFYTHMRIETSRSTTNDNSEFEGGSKDGDKVANLHKAKVIKNKMAAPFKKAEYMIRYGEGVDIYSEVMELAHEYGVAKKRGESFTWNDKYGIKQFTRMMKEDDSIYQKLREEVLQASRVKKVEPIEEPDMEAITEGLTTEIENDNG